jgi:hypothetical protein
MAGILPVYELGPITFNIAASNIVLGGNVVMIDPTNAGYVVAAKGTSAGVGSITVLGVSLTDGVGPSVSENSTDPLGNNILALTQYPNDCSVALYGVFNLVFAGACNFGELVRTVDGTTAGQTTAGQVYPYTNNSTTTYDQIVGRCVQPAGVASGGTGMVLIGIGAGA